MESASDVIAHAAHRHGTQRLQHHVARQRLAGADVLAEQKKQLRRPRKLRRIAEAAPATVEGLLELPPCLVEGRDVRVAARTFARRQDREPAHDLASRADDVLPLVAPGPGNLLQHVGEGRTAPPARGWKIGAAVEGLRSGVSQTLMGHPPAPVVACTKVIYTRSTSGRSSRSTLIGTKSRLRSAAMPRPRTTRAPSHGTSGRSRSRSTGRSVCALAPRLIERRLTPRPPVHRVVRVLQEVGTLLCRQTIGHPKIIVCTGADRCGRVRPGADGCG